MSNVNEMVINKLTEKFTTGKMSQVDFIAAINAINAVAVPPPVEVIAAVPVQEVTTVKSGKRGAKGKAANEVATSLDVKITTNFNTEKNKITSFFVSGDAAKEVLAAYIASKPTMLPTLWKAHKGIEGVNGYFFGQSHLQNVIAALQNAGCKVSQVANTKK